MRYTYVVDVGDGVKKDFPFSFAGQDTGYLAVSNIAVYVAGVQVGNYTIRPSAPNTVTFSTAPAVGAEVLIRRIMPKLVPYTDFSRGNPFSQDALNDTNLQMLYLIQEIYDGYLPEGFFFRVDIDMRGHKLINLGDGVNDGDSVNMKQLNVEVVRNDSQDSRIGALEDNIVAGTLANFLSQVYKANGGETTINTTNDLPCVALYIDGLFQHKVSGSYSQVGGIITLAEPLKAGWEVYLILGTDLPPSTVYATIESVAALQAVVDGINTQYAKKGANTDITSLGGLTTALSMDQGGTGNKVGRAASATKLDVPRGVWINLASSSSVNFDGTSDINPGVQGVLPIANGGTGNISGKAVALSTARSFQVNLSSTSAVSFDGSANATPGVTGVLALVNGGTGSNTKAGAQTSLDIFPTTGKVDGSDAAAGKIGEHITSTGAATALTNTVTANLASITLTPGDWDVTGAALYNPNGSTLTTMYTGISTSSANMPAFPNRTIFRTSSQYEVDCPSTTVRINVTVNTTIYLVTNCEFSGGTGVSGTGYIRARRIR